MIDIEFLKTRSELIPAIIQDNPYKKGSYARIYESRFIREND